MNSVSCLCSLVGRKKVVVDFDAYIFDEGAIEVSLMGDWAAIEQLEFNIRKEDVQSFFVADANTWTPFLEVQDGFAGRIQLVDARVYNDSSIPPSSNITITNLIIWESFEAWKAIPTQELMATQAEFEQQFGSGPPPRAIPTDDGWMIYKENNSSFSSNLGGTQVQTPLGCMLSDNPLQSVCSMQGSSSQNENKGDYEFYMWGFFASLGIILVLVVYIVHLHMKFKTSEKSEKDDLTQKLCHPA